MSKKIDLRKQLKHLYSNLNIGQKYSVMDVPKTVINEKTEFVGAVPEELFVQQVVLAQKSPSMYV